MRKRTGRIADEGSRGEGPRFDEAEFALILRRAIESDLDWVRSTRRWERLLHRLTSEMAKATRPALSGGWVQALGEA